MMKTILRALTTILLLAAALLPLNEASAKTPKYRLEGAWDVAVTFQGHPFKFSTPSRPAKRSTKET